jgi:putative ABC transport system permease protein
MSDQLKPVVIVVTFARQFLSGENAIGKRFQPGISSWENDKTQMRDHRSRRRHSQCALNTDLNPSLPAANSGTPFNELAMLVKNQQPTHAVTSRLGEVGDGPERGVVRLTMDECSSVAAPRFNTTLLSIFAGVALVLTATGLYGVMSYSVAQRTNEIGIRMALGAQTRDVLGLIVKDGVKMVGLGLLLGMGGALVLTRLLETLLFGVTTRDPVTFMLIAGLLSLVAMLACYIPALRATRVDPLEALRCE